MRAAALASILVLSSAIVAAQDKSGFAVNIGVGVSQVKDRDGSESFSASDFGYLLGGEYRFNENFALRLGTFGLGSPRDEFNFVSTTIEVKGIDVVVRFIHPVSQRVELFALAGSAGYTADLEPGGNNGLFGDDAVEFGLGLDIGSGENFAFRFAGRYFGGPRDESGALTTVGFNYRF